MTNRIPLRLHIPELVARPGNTAAFDRSLIRDAGVTRRPAVDAAEADMHDLPYGLVRVLGDDGRATGAWNPRLSPDVLRRGLTAMCLTRVFDERLFRAHRQGKTSFYMKSAGEEAIGAAQSMMLDRGDMCFPTYRVPSWPMARGYPLADLVNQIFSNARDPLRERQLPILYSARDYGFYSLAGNVGSRFGHAVGWAMASAFKDDDKIALGYIGDGTTAEGDCHEALTFASVYRAPVILCITNNQWAISSFSGIAGANETTFTAKALGYGLRVDGNGFLAVWAATEWAAERAPTNRGATVIEFYTYRAEGHSTSDDPTKYPPTDEPLHWPLGDPVDRLKAHLTAIGEWDDARHAAMIEDLDRQVRAVVKEAEAVATLGMSKPSVAEMF